MIRAIIFDFGNVICSFDLHLFLQRVAPFSARSFADLQNHLGSFTDLGRDYETGLISSDRFFDEVRARARLTIDKADFVKAYVDIFTPIPETMDVIRKLKPTYKLGLVSNTNEWHYQHGIRSAEVFPLFDAVTLSFEVKAMKPARAVYDDILRKLLVTPPECIYIDDIPENVSAAIEIGMQGIHFTGGNALERSLRSLGVFL